MPIEVRAIQERRASCTFSYLDGSVTLEYRAVKAGALTQEDLNRLLEECRGKPEEEQRRILAAFFLDIMTGWDVTTGGAPYPLTLEAVAALDSIFQGVCLAAVMEHVNTGMVSGQALSALGIAPPPALAPPAPPAPKKARRPARQTPNEEAIHTS